MVADPRRKPKRARRPRITPGQQERFLNSDEAMKVIPPDVRRTRLKALERQRRALSRRTPSSTWRDDAWFHGAEFPPAWDHPRTHELTEPPATAMICCRGCRRETPPNYISSSGHCEDCKLCAMSPGQLAHIHGSSSAINLAKLKASARGGRPYFGGF
jgi:hypothetical protein